MMTTTKPHLHPQLVKEDINCSASCDTGSTVPAPSNNNNSPENSPTCQTAPNDQDLEQDLQLTTHAQPYKPIQARGSPFFTAGQFHFPPRPHQYLPTVYAHPWYKPTHPRWFGQGQFQHFVWTANPLVIIDAHIISINPETMYFGIYYNIEVQPSAWNNKFILWGTPIIFRGFKSAQTKYITT